RTSQSDLMSAFGGKADMARCNAKRPLITQADINLICKGHRDGRTKCTKINHTPSNLPTASLATSHRSSIFIINFHRFIVAFHAMRGRAFPRKYGLLRTLLVGAVVTTFIGCSCPVSRGGGEASTPKGCISRPEAATPIELKRAPFRPVPKITTV